MQLVPHQWLTSVGWSWWRWGAGADARLLSLLVAILIGLGAGWGSAVLGQSPPGGGVSGTQVSGSDAAGVPQAPPPGTPLPRLNLFPELGVGGASTADGQQLQLKAWFTLEQGTRRGSLHLRAEMAPGWHVYSLTQPAGGTQPSSIKVQEQPSFRVTGPFQPDRPPRVKKVDLYPVPIEEHEGQVVWSAPLEVAEGVDPGSLAIELRYSGQVCSDQTCIPIFGEQVTAQLEGYTPPASRGSYRPAAHEAQLTLEGYVEPQAIAPGDTVRLVLTARPEPGWHVYAYAPRDPDVVGANKPTLIYVTPLPGWGAGPVRASSAPKTKPAAAAGLPQEAYHEEPVTWTLELRCPVDSPRGEAVLSGYIGFQTCKESCLPPQVMQFRARLPVQNASQEGRVPLEFVKPQRGSAPVASYADLAQLVASQPAATSGPASLAALLPMIGFGLLGGLILNLMPCVLPVIGLKILALVQQAGQRRGRILVLNLWFTLGLLSVFLVLATAAAFANLSWGQQFTYTWFKVAMVLLVFAFALSFLNVWEVPIPGFAQSESTSRLQHQEGAAGAFFKGMFTTLLATPCSGPFLGPVFAYTLTQPPLVTYVLFLSVGLGMAFPYLLVGLFPGLIRWLPKPGEWMETFKQLMGFVLLGTVVYLFSTISSEYFIPTLASVVGVWFACWLIGRVPPYEPLPRQLRAWGLGLAAAGLVGWASFQYLGPAKHLFEWQPYQPDAIARLQQEGKAVMVDFTADWCLTCQANFRFAINTPRVQQIVQQYGVVPMLADWTDQNDTIKQKLAELNANSIPLLAIYPAGRPGEVIVLRDALLEQQVVDALQHATGARTAASGSSRTASAAEGASPTGR
jgi:suppressor for copper-sensitivity B